MCGIAGVLGHRINDDLQQLIASNMLESLYHRGPDRQSYIYDQDVSLLLMQSRLSIQDLSESGNQPMVSSCGNYTIVFNGEIYNHLELREEVSKTGTIIWNGHSDTETLLKLIIEWGMEKTLNSIHGMFAFSLWDKKRKELHLVRDRMGEKPLYYGKQGNILYFASELKAFRAHPEFKPDINKSQITTYLQLGYIPEPNSIYTDIYKCLPGHHLTFNDAGVLLSDISYWSLRDKIAINNNISAPEAINELEVLLSKSIQRQEISDVQLGAFLSGGVDSSIVVSLMKNQASVNLNTFSIGFSEQDYDEAKIASKIAKHLGTNHHEFYLSSDDALDIIPQLPFIYDEPFADSSQIPTLFLAQMTKQHVTVALSGDGGDELFGGYNRHVKALPYWQKWRYKPEFLKQMMAHSIRLIPPELLNKVASIMLSGKVRQPGYKLNKFANMLSANNFDEFYTSLVTVPGVSQLSLARDIGYSPKMTGDLDPLVSIQYLDATEYLPGDILTKVDRAGMSQSLETRMPLLDHSVVEFSFSLPDNLKIKQGQGKWILRQILHKYVPESFYERAKSGFAIPLGSWLKGPLREWAGELISANKIEAHGLLSTSKVIQLWNEHLSGKKDHQDILWRILMLQAWLEYNS